MPTDKQIAAQLKRDVAQAKRDTASRVHNSVMTILCDSAMYGSDLWPKRGFIPIASGGIIPIDTITIGMLIIDESEYKKVRFNIWGKVRRVTKQHDFIIKLFDQAYHDGIYFHPEYPEHVHKLSAHYHDDRIMAMINYKFTIDQ